MTTWFTSDLHHEHKNICQYTDRNLETDTANHTDWLIENWNSSAKAGDLTYSLGDFSFSKKYEDIAKFTKALNGQKIFIKGNHDDRKILDHLVQDKLIVEWYDYKEIKIADISAVLFHFPISSWHRQGYGAVHLHGHCHGNHKDTKGKMLDVGIDSAYNIYGEHRLFSEEDILQYMKNQPIYVSDHHKDYTNE